MLDPHSSKDQRPAFLQPMGIVSKSNTHAENCNDFARSGPTRNRVPANGSVGSGKPFNVLELSGNTLRLGGFKA
jgi:hypothetical protein